MNGEADAALMIVLQAREPDSIADEVNADPELRKLIESSRSTYHSDDVMTTAELIQSLSSKDFA